jgi:hypothetical protein
MKNRLKISSREYKVVLDHRLFANRKEAAATFANELSACAKRLGPLRFEGRFKTDKRRTIIFLDTCDWSIRLNRFIFRQRYDIDDGEFEYTLKCRTPDRYIAANAPVQSVAAFKHGLKFEEDICAPFACRFSRSNTVAGPRKAPWRLEEAADIFPALGNLVRDGRKCSPKLKLLRVNSVKAFERVLSGPTLKLPGAIAEAAIILWSDGLRGRPLAAEFSFRYRDRGENYAAKTARGATDFFDAIQSLDWRLVGGPTKTELVYQQ